MAFDWSNYLELAKNLSNAADEASLRTAVSRSYYCAYNLALARAKLNQYRPPPDNMGGIHEQLWELYGRNETDEDCKFIALWGPRMKRRRVKADYQLHYPAIQQEAKDAIEDAELCVAKLAALPQGLPKDVPRRWSR